MTRFLILTQYFPPEIGAPQTRLKSVADELLRRGHEVDVVTALPNYPTGRIADGYRGAITRHETLDGLRIHRVWMYASMGRGMKRLAGYLSFAAMAPIGLVRCRRPDVVLVESPPLFLGVPGILAARIWRAATVLNVADLWPDAAVDLGALREGWMLRGARWLEHRCYSWANVVNAATVGLAETIRDRTADRQKVVLLPNGVDVDRFRPEGGDPNELAALGLPTTGVIIHAGTMSLIHGLDSSIRAAAQVPEITLALIGAGSAEHALRQLAVDLDASNVRFVPPISVDRLARVLPAAAAALVSVRNVEQARSVRPSKLFPAMASGLPVVYAGEGEGADIVRTAGCGAVVPNDDVAEIAREFRRAADGDKVRGQRGRAWVVEHLAWPAIVDAWLADLHRLIPGKLGRRSRQETPDG